MATIVGLGLGIASADATVPAMPYEIPLRPNEKASIQARAEAGDHEAQLIMAEINAEWAGERPDYIAALSWYEKATNHPEKPKDQLYLFARFRDPAQADALRRFNSDHAALYAKAQTGDPQALLTFAWHTPHMASGISGDAPFPHWLLLAAQAGSDEAQDQIGYLYLRAYYVRQLGRHDDNEAARERLLNWKFDDLNRKFGDFSTEVRKDEPLGFDDEHLQTDIANAIYWLGKAAVKGDALSEYNLGLAYAVSGPTRDMNAASLWLHRALFLDPSLPVTACDLDLKGQIIAGPEDEGGAKTDEAAAFRCYDRVRAQHVGTYYVLGYMYHRGLGVRRDDTRAIQFLEKAQAYSDWRPAALHELGLLYRDSSTIRHDPVKSIILLAKAQAAPVTPSYYCGHLAAPNDTGGPAFSPGYERWEAEEDLKKAYHALPSSQKLAVTHRLKAEGLPIPLAPGVKAPILPPFPMPCV